MTERQAYLAWSLCPGVGPGRIAQLESEFRSVSAAWREFEEISEKWPVGLRGKVKSFQKNFKLDNFEKKLKSLGINYLAWSDKEYPDKLKEIAHAPRVFYVQTKVKDWGQLWKQAWLGVVGTRKITSYGVGVTKMMVCGVVEQKVGIVSGLMYGVDETAHRSCVESGGMTIGVWAGGLDTLKVGGRSSLARQVYESGGVLMSPYPPGVVPVPATFPARNEWVAGLSDALLVVEGSAQSGTLITAGFAAELGRSVLVVPGPITSSQSAAPIGLLKAGATPVSSVEDVLSELPISPTVVRRKHEQDLGEQEMRIIELLGRGEMSGDDLARELKVGMASLMEMLTMLELSGVIMRSGEAWVICRK